MDFFEKIKWVLGILMVFFLILATNLIDRNNFLRVKESVSSIYDDRLLAFNMIFELDNIVHEKELAIATIDKDPSFYLQQYQTQTISIGALLESFKETKLTLAGSMIFSDLNNNLEALKKAEKTFVQTDFKEGKALNNAIANIKNDLHELSEIQLSEGKRQVAISQNAVDTVELFTHIEIYVLIFLAIAIQIVLMYKPKDS